VLTYAGVCSKGRNIEEIYRNNNNGVLDDVSLNQEITQVC
jgi:hypothetical protein